MRTVWLLVVAAVACLVVGCGRSGPQRYTLTPTLVPTQNGPYIGDFIRGGPARGYDLSRPHAVAQAIASQLAAGMDATADTVACRPQGATPTLLYVCDVRDGAVLDVRLTPVSGK